MPPSMCNLCLRCSETSNHLFLQWSLFMPLNYGCGFKTWLTTTLISPQFLLLLSYIIRVEVHKFHSSSHKPLSSFSMLFGGAGMLEDSRIYPTIDFVKVLFFFLFPELGSSPSWFLISLFFSLYEAFYIKSNYVLISKHFDFIKKNCD